MENRVTVNLKDVAVRWKSKKELFAFLASDWGVYMPPIKDANTSYVYGVVSGKIKVLFRESYVTFIVCQNYQSQDYPRSPCAWFNRWGDIQIRKVKIWCYSVPSSLQKI